MAFFFALAAKEVTEATAPGGALHSPRRAALPLAAAVGGMLVPALIFVGLTIALDRPNLERGWAIPCATDIAFSYLAARIIFGERHPAIPFLLLLAIADDALGLLIIAAFYPTGPLRLVEFTVILARRHAAGVVAEPAAGEEFLALRSHGRRPVVVCVLPGRAASGARAGAYRAVPSSCRPRSRVVRGRSRRARHAQRVRALVQASGRRDALFLRPRERRRRDRQRRSRHLVRADRHPGWQTGGGSRRNGPGDTRGPPSAQGRDVARSDRRRHSCRHRVYGGIVLRHRCLPLRPFTGRNQDGCVAQLRGIFHRPRARHAS